MKRYRLVVMTAPAEGREAEYNEWYNYTHLPEVMSAKGFTVAQRFRMHNALAPGDTWPYLAIYEIETDDLSKAMAEVRDHASAPPDGLMGPSQYVVIYEEFGAPVKHGETPKRAG